MEFKKLENKKTLILGFGREGMETFLFLAKKFPEQKIGVADKKEFKEFSPEAKKFLRKHKNTALHLGKEYLHTIGEYDVIVKTPGIPLSSVAPLLTKKQTITSQTEIFFANCKATIIGVTGTKGKSTVCSLLYQVLKTAGKRAHLVGNIGNPGLRLLSSLRVEDVVVYELSSFQLMNLKKSPHIALLLNVYPEHFDHHKNFAGYRAAKANIARHQTVNDILIYNKNDRICAKIAKQSKAKKIGFMPGSSRIIPKEKKQWIAPVEPVLLAANIFRIPLSTTKKALMNFQPLPHRMERAGEWKGITFINDSAATNPGAAVAALDHFGAQVSSLIAGGSEKGTSFKEFAEAILKQSIATLILFPATGETIWKEVQRASRRLRIASLPRVFFVSSMKEAVRLCYAHAKPNSVCLLSPACASFTTFKDYKDRGEQFKKFAKQLSTTEYGQSKTTKR